jgi:hypothetical protein
MKIEELLDPETLPDDLRWLVTEFKLAPKDPVFVLIAWHWHRVKAAEDSLRAATVEFSSAVDSRVDVLAGAAESTAALSELLVQVQASLEEKPALLTAQVEQELKAPLAKIAALEKSLDATLRTARDAAGKVRRREILAALLNRRRTGHRVCDHSHPRMNAPRAGVIALCFATAIAARVAVPAPSGYWLTVVAESMVWFAYGALIAESDPSRARVLRLWGLDWTRDEACCHFFVTGATGTGKTARAIVPIVHGLRRALPSTGIMAIDSKGALWKPLAEIARALGHEASLRLIRVRPSHVPPKEWQPPLRLNLLADRSVPWTTYAKIIVDTASAAGQQGGQSFFKESARDVITHAMQALDVAGFLVSLDNVHNVVCNSADMESLVEKLEKSDQPAAAVEVQFFRDFSAQAPEQRSGTVGTVANYLRPYTPPDIAEVFCSAKPNFTLEEIDQGRLICLRCRRPTRSSASI